MSVVNDLLRAEFADVAAALWADAQTLHECGFGAAFPCFVEACRLEGERRSGRVT